MTKTKLKELIKVTWLPVVVASLCCLSPVVFVLLGLATTSFAASLANTLYGDYAWYFRLAGLVFLVGSFIYYLRRSKGICTLDQVKRRRTEIINLILLTLVVGVIGYIVFLYGILEVIGWVIGLW